jgi:hypothetical protein
MFNRWTFFRVTALLLAGVVSTVAQAAPLEVVSTKGNVGVALVNVPVVGMAPSRAMANMLVLQAAGDAPPTTVSALQLTGDQHASATLTGGVQVLFREDTAVHVLPASCHAALQEQGQWISSAAPGETQQVGGVSVIGGTQPLCIRAASH